MKLKQLVLLLLVSKIGFSQSTFFRFNEYSFSNINTIADPLGTMGLPSYSPDWVEIRNVNTSPPGPGNHQQLSGIYISDDRYNLHKWQVPYHNNLPIYLDSGQVQVIFLCGHDKGVNGTPLDVSGVGLHANFQVNQTKKGGAVLYLTRSVNATTPFDSVHIKISAPNNSWGRCYERMYPTPTCTACVPGYWPNGTWRLYATPTPGTFNPKWPAYFTDYLPKPVFDIKPGYYSSLGNVQISDTSLLSAASILGYTNYPSVCIIATNDCIVPDTLNTIAPLTATIVVSGSPRGTPLTGSFPIVATSTLSPPPIQEGYMIRAIMHDGSAAVPPVITPTTVPSFTATPRYLDSFEAYGAFYDSSYKMPVTFVCVDTSKMFISPTGLLDTSITTPIDYFDKTGKELWRNQGQSMISKLDFFNPIGSAAFKKQWQFSFRAEDEYGYNYTNPYQFFQDPVIGISNRADFPELIYRAGSEESFLYSTGLGSNGFPAAHVRDFFNHTMTMRHKLNFEQAHYIPTYMLINGIDKGIYYIKEPFDSTYTDYYFDRPKAAILANGVIGGASPLSCAQFTVTPYSGFGTTGGNALFRWNTFYAWAINPFTKVHIPSTFYQLADSVDFLSLNDYTIYNMLSVNADYLKRSAMWWKGLPNDTSDHRPSKWRCVLANTDITWGFYTNIYNGISPDPSVATTPCEIMGGFNLTWPPSTTIPASATSYPLMALWNKLMDNDTFKNDFLSRYSDLLNTALSCDSLELHLKYVRTLLATSDMQSHVSALLYDGINAPLSDSVRYWNLALDSMNAFIAQRCSLVTEGLKNCFNLEGPYNLCVDVSPAGTGYVLLNSLTLKNFIWNGKYLDSVTMIAKAIANQNYQFDHWETTPTNYTTDLHPDNKSDSINFFVSRDFCLKAVFKLKPADQTHGEPMIPSGFSPNGDGNNDIFNIYGIADASSYELEIYNRWGEMIFRSIDKTHGWDGTYNGAPAPVGIYAYRYNIILNGKTYKSKGSVTLLR